MELLSGNELLYFEISITLLVIKYPDSLHKAALVIFV
jgi:hypothetical protein